MTFIVIVVCVISYSNKWFAQALDIWLLNIIIIGVIFDFSSAMHSLRYLPYEDDFSKRENEMVRIVAMAIGAIFVLTGYVLGFIAWSNNEIA